MILIVIFQSNKRYPRTYSQRVAHLTPGFGCWQLALTAWISQSYPTPVDFMMSPSSPSDSTTPETLEAEIVDDPVDRLEARDSLGEHAEESQLGQDELAEVPGNDARMDDAEAQEIDAGGEDAGGFAMSGAPHEMRTEGDVRKLHTDEQDEILSTTNPAGCHQQTPDVGPHAQSGPSPGNHEAGTDEARILDTKRHLAASYDFGFQGGFRPAIPLFGGSDSSFPRFQREFIMFARWEGVDWVFTSAKDSANDVNVGDPEVAVYTLQAQFGEGVVAAHVKAWQLLSTSLKSEMDRNILFRVTSPGAAWRGLIEAHGPTPREKLALLEKMHRTKIRAKDNPIAKLLEMEITAQTLRTYDDPFDVKESLILAMFLHALPREYDIQRAVLEARAEGSLSREAVIFAVRGRYESPEFKQLVHNKKNSSSG